MPIFFVRINYASLTHTSLHVEEKTKEQRKKEKQILKKVHLRKTIFPRTQGGFQVKYPSRHVTWKFIRVTFRAPHSSTLDSFIQMLTRSMASEIFPQISRLLVPELNSQLGCQINLLFPRCETDRPFYFISSLLCFSNDRLIVAQPNGIISSLFSIHFLSLFFFSFNILFSSGYRES